MTDWSYDRMVMPKPTFHNLPAEKQRRIIDAAVTEFARQPYARATLDRIVDAAGISKGSMYQYFGGKADLYRWLLTDYMAQKKLAAIGASAPPDGASVWDVLEQALLSGIRFAVAEPDLARLGTRFLRDHEQEPDLAAVSDHHNATAEAWIDSLLRDAVARGELRADLDITVTTVLITHTLGQGMLDQLARRLGLTLTELFEAPDTIAQLSDEALGALVGAVLRLLQHGASR